MRAPLRVAHCIHGLGLGGAQEIIRQIVARGAGDCRYFVYSTADGVLRERVEAAGATVRVLPRRLPKLDPAWVLALARAMRRDGIELVHAHLFGDTLHGYLAARLAGGLPMVATLHIGPEGLSPWQRAGYRWLLGRRIQVVACGEFVRDAYAAAGWTTARPLAAVANGIAAPPLVPCSAAELGRLKAALGVPADALVFAAVGRLVEQKGFDVLLAALRQARPALPAGARLVLLGEGPLGAVLAARARELGIAGEVVFAGFRDDVAQLLPAVDAVVFSSLFEGLPVALLEAMAAARCIVATACPGIVEAVRPDREALIVPVGEAAPLAGALVRTAADPGLRARLGEAARRRFLAAYTAPRMVASYESLYRELAPPPRGGAWRRAAARI